MRTSAGLAPVLVTPSAVTPVSLDEVKAHLHIDAGDDDALVTGLIAAATSLLDGWSGILGRALVSQTWRQDLRRFPSAYYDDTDDAGRLIPLPLAPVQSATITYYDTDNALQTLDPDSYEGPFPGFGDPVIRLASGSVWPSTYDRADAVSVTFVAGYGDQPDDVPAAIRQAMLLLIGGWYENREAVVTGITATQLPLSASMLLAPFRRVRF